MMVLCRIGKCFDMFILPLLSKGLGPDEAGPRVHKNRDERMGFFVYFTGYEKNKFW